MSEAVLKAEEKVSKNLNKSVYVGPISRELALLQCGATLCLVNLARVLRECAYQRLLRSFGNVTKIQLKESLTLGIEDPASGFDPIAHANVNINSLVDRFVKLLEDQAEMLDEYISLGISAGTLTSIPNALGITSDGGLVLEELPMFLIRLCAETNWSDEKMCFCSLCRYVADFAVDVLLPTEEAASRLDSSSPAQFAETAAAAFNAAVEAGEFEDVAAAAAASSRKRARIAGP